MRTARKQHERQVVVAQDIADQVSGGSKQVFGVMVESHLCAGAQKFTPGKDDPAKLTYGQSITDARIGWDDSEKCWRSGPAPSRPVVPLRWAVRRDSDANSAPDVERLIGAGRPPSVDDDQGGGEHGEPPALPLDAG